MTTNWIKAPNIVALFNSFNKIAPDRDKTSDGTIGNLEHTTGVSGHNPDDTAGVRAERSDSDNIPEVRAGDVDVDLRQPGLTMEMCVQAFLKSPEDRERFIYVIYNRRIWSKSTGWVQKAYTGDSPHDHHAHFSGDPTYDNDTRPIKSIEFLVSVEEGIKMFCKQGDSGEHVQAMQYLLQLAGFDPGVVDGNYGPATTAALKAARATVGSKQDGSVYDAHAYGQLLLVFVRKFGTVNIEDLTNRVKAIEARPVVEGLQLPMTVVINKA